MPANREPLVSLDADAPQGSVAVVGRLECGDFDLAHLQHGLADALIGLGGVVAGELLELAGDDLPRDAVLVLAPAARPRLAALGGEEPQ